MIRELFYPVFIALFLALLSSPLNGQQNCIDFENIPAGTAFTASDYEAGSLIFTINGVPVTIGPFTYFNGTTDLLEVRVENPSSIGVEAPDYIGQALWISNATISADYSALGYPVEKITFDFWDGGGEENFAVNGQEVQVVNDLTELPSEIAPGVFITVETTPGSFWGKVTLEGEISSLLIGGQEFYLDNVCIEQSVADCFIKEVKAEAEECTPNGIFYVNLDFEYGNVPSEQFIVRGNGLNHGQYFYQDLPVRLGPFEGDGSKEWEFVVMDSEDETCSDFAELGKIDCNQEPCDITELILEFSAGCNDDGYFDATVFFEVSNGRNAGFDLFVNGEFHSYYQYYPTEAIFIPSIAKGTGEPISIKVADNDNLECYAEKTLISPECSPNESCKIFGVEAGAQDCDENGKVMVEFAFQVEQPGSDGFDVIAGDFEFGPFEYGQNFYTFGPIPANGQHLEYKIRDKSHPDCYAYGELALPNCNENGACTISNLEVAFSQDCNADGYFNAEISFKVSGGNNNGFDLFVNGDFHSYYSEYPDGHVRVESIAKGTGEPISITVADNDNPNCVAEKVLDSPNCSNSGSDCKISEVHAEAHPCNDDGYFMVDVEFVVDQPASNGFKIYAGDEEFGTYEYGAVFYTFGPLKGHGQAYEIKIKDLEDTECFGYGVVEAPDCLPGDQCKILEVQAEAYQCDDAGKVLLDIWFEVQNPNSNQFYVIGGDQEFGPFPYGKDFYTIGPFHADGQVLEFKVKDTENAQCFGYGEIKLPDCNPSEDCKIYEVHAEAHACNDEGYFMVDVEFLLQNPASNGFKIFAGDHEFGPFEYGQDFYTFGPLPGHGHGIEIKILDLENPDCYGYGELLAPDCLANDQCKISEVHAEAHPCNDDGYFMVDVEFQVQNPASDGFHIIAGEQEFGPFVYGQDFYTFGPLKGDKEKYEIKIKDLSNPDCFAYGFVEAPNCGQDPGECAIVNVTAEASPCTDNGKYFIDVKIEVSNPGNDGFVIVLFDQEFGPFEYGSSLYGLGPFLADGKTYDFKVKDLIQEGCYVHFNFTAPDCMSTENCEIGEIKAVPQECDDNGKFEVLLDFDFANVGDDKFTVKGNGNHYGTFSYEELPILIGPFEGDGHSELEFVVADNTTPSCHNFVVLDAIKCQDNVWPGDANDDNVAGKFDILNIGLAYGHDGPKRTDASIEWAGMPAEDWDMSFKDGTNFKHADSNGDGVVDAEDIEAVILNYGKEHGEVEAYVHPEGTPNDPPLYADLAANGDLQAGQDFAIPVVLGDEQRPVEAIYGIAFTLNFDPEKVDLSSLEFGFEDSWMGTPNQDLFSFSKQVTDGGKVDVALTRKNGANGSGFGPLVIIHGIIQDDILGKMAIEISDIKAIDYDQEPVLLYNQLQEADFTSSTLDFGDPGLLKVYPNPSTQYFWLESNVQEEIQSIQLLNVVGKEVRRIEQASPLQRMDVENLEPGLYLIRVTYENMEITKKITIF